MRKGVEEAKAIERVLHKYMQLEDKPFSFGNGIKLTQREIHSIDAIGDNPEANITQLAKMQGVTKGAMSQMVYRLVDKGYVRKVSAPDSDKELRLSLTLAGQDAWKAHKQYHERQSGDATDILASLSPEESQVLTRVLDAFEAMMDRALAEVEQ